MVLECLTLMIIVGVVLILMIGVLLCPQILLGKFTEDILGGITLFRRIQRGDASGMRVKSVMDSFIFDDA